MNKTKIQGKFFLTAALTTAVAFASFGAAAATLDPTGARTSQEVVLERKFLPTKGTKDARRPYEMVWANRRTDEVPPVDRLESADGWIAAGENAVASVTNADDRLLFGDGTLRLDYAASGDSPKVRLRRETPLKLAAFDAPLLFALGAENVVWRRNRVTRHDRYQGWGQPAFQTQGCENMALP